MKLINLKYFVILTATFILFTVIGTLSHEYGHIIIAQSLGYKTTLHYASMHYEIPELKNKTLSEKQLRKLKNDILLIRIGGPLQTILTGITGLLILYVRRKKIKKFGLKFIDWLAVFLSLFWLREIFNLIMSISLEFIKPKGSCFGGDEKRIAELLHIWQGSLSCILGITGLIVTIFIVFKIVPKKLRFSFILSGIIGGIAGFILWMYILGPKILP